MQSHLEIAREQGMKAGFKVYMQTLEKSGLPAAQAKLSELRSMGKRKAFAVYCATKGPDVQAQQAVRTRSSRAAKVEAVAELGLAEEILAARQRLAELEADFAAEQSKPKVTRASRTSKPKVKENLWRAWAIAKHGIPTTVGATFTYKGKRRSTTFKVTRITTEGVYTVRA